MCNYLETSQLLILFSILTIYFVLIKNYKISKNYVIKEMKGLFKKFILYFTCFQLYFLNGYKSAFSALIGNGYYEFFFPQQAI